MNNDTNRVAFEAAYCKHFKEHRGIPISAEAMVSMRDGDSYGDRAYLNGMWQGWKLRDALRQQHAEVAARIFAAPYAASEYQPDQWWVKELEGLWGSGAYPVTDDTRRAAKVACNMVHAIEPDRRDAEKFRTLLAHWWEVKVKFGDHNDPREIRAVFRVSTEVSHAGKVELDQLVTDFCTAAQQAEAK